MQQKPTARPWYWIALLPRPRLDRASLRAALRPALTGLLVWGLLAAFLAAVQFATPDLPDNDGFYHIKLAWLMRTEGLTPAFPWLPLSILNPREFYDHHFLFHVALIPFTGGDLRLGAKWAAVLFASLAFLSVWYVLKNQRVPYAALWALGLAAVSEAFLYRMSITRAQSLSLGLLMLAVDALLRQKHARLALLGFLYVWLYDAFPLLGVLAVLYAAAALLTGSRLPLRALWFTAGGLALGLLINPYLPHNIVFAFQHILPKLFAPTTVRVGNEWFPYTTAQLLENSPLALAAFASGALGLGFSGRKIDLRTAFAFLVACLFGLMLFQSRRFVEYFPPFALLFAAFAWTPVIHDYAQRVSRAAAPLRRHLPALLLAAVLLPGAFFSLRAAQSSLRDSKPYTTYAGASAWLAANTPAGARVFQTDWDDFPRLFYYNTHNTYLIGLDPTYLQLYDADLYDRWAAITRGEVDQPAAEIVQQFGARYVISDLRHGDFLAQAAADPRFREVFRDADAVVFTID